MSEPLEVLTDMRDLLRDLPERIGLVVRPPVPERMPAVDVATKSLPLQNDLPVAKPAEPMSQRPLPPEMMPVSPPVAMPPMMPTQRQVESASLPLRMPMAAPEAGDTPPVRMPAASSPVAAPSLPLMMPASPQAESRPLPVASSPVHQGIVPDAPSAPAAQAAPATMGSMGGNESALADKMASLTDAIHSLIATMGSSGGRPQPGRSEYTPPERSAAAAAPSNHIVSYKGIQRTQKSWDVAKMFGG